MKTSFYEIFLRCSSSLLVEEANRKDDDCDAYKAEACFHHRSAGDVNTDHVKQFRFIARIVDERLVIFESDGKTVYFETGIKEEALSEPIRQQAQHGIGFTTEAGMYDFLESYSS